MEREGKTMLRGEPIDVERRLSVVELEPAQGRPFDVVVLAASAGGNAAIETILRALPEDFALPIVVMQHLAPGLREPLRPYGRSLRFEVEWASEDVGLAPGRVLVAPPRSFVELVPDGTSVVAPCERGAIDKPIDRLLDSVARSFGHRAIAVVLSGMMDDGASGACKLRAAGGVVIVQTGAEYGSMPQATIRSGGADVALPVEDIARVLVDLAVGRVVPRSLTELDAVATLFAGEGRARAEMRTVNWTATPLGPVLQWSAALSTAVRNVLSSPFPSCIYWGPEFVQIYNEAFLAILGAKPLAAGRPARITWAELFSAIGPRLESVLQTGNPVCAEDQLYQLERDGCAEELYFTYSYSALHDSAGGVHGVLTTLIDTTARVRATRRNKLLRDLAAIERGESASRVAESAASFLADAPLDVPFALLYMFARGRARATLAACAGVAAGSRAAPHMLVLLDQSSVWPLDQVARAGSTCTLNDVPSRLSGAQLGPWPESPTTAKLIPISSGAQVPICGVLVLGLSPRLQSDPTYEDFLGMVGQHVTAAIADAEVRRRERERADRLVDLDKSKVEFFSNVSHEFRTPLTLLLGPLEEMLARRPSLPDDLERAVDTAARNGRRLLALVNTLLDFSEAESRRRDAQYQLTDLSALTLEIASTFRGAVESAGLQLQVQGAVDMPPVWVDPQMWEKIVSNLLSNALKFTFNGQIMASLKALPLHAQLEIVDTGVGIPSREIPNLFKRFHRVRGARARTAEGSGIGLAIVDDLVKRLGGQIIVRSKENHGTSFTVWVPYKSARIVTEPGEYQAAYQPTEFASQLAHDAERWTVDPTAPGGALTGAQNDVFGPPQLASVASGGRLLVADDNADMREYLTRLLSPHWQVVSVADGQSAFEAALEQVPDIILADVMMPGIDGFELLKRVRARRELRGTPVVLLTARVGEEAAIEGLMAGAGDYIAKPFSPRELVARIAAVVERARADAALRESEERFRTLFDTMHDGFAYLELVRDEKGRPIDMLTIDANQAYGRHLGLDVARLHGRRGELTGAVDDRDRELLSLYERVVRTGQSERREVRARLGERWFDLGVYPRSGERFAVLLSDITERKRRGLQQAFLLKLSDALRPLADSVEIQRAAVRVLGQQLNIDGASYADVEPDSKIALVHNGYTRDGRTKWTGSFSIAALSQRVARGEVVVIEDADTSLGDCVTEPLARASISVPLLKGGRLAAVLFAHHGQPRAWTEQEVELVQETAERTWAAVERARAEAELHARNEELERFHRVAVGRELRMIELKEQINALLVRLGEPPRYPLAFDQPEMDDRA